MVTPQIGNQNPPCWEKLINMFSTHEENMAASNNKKRDYTAEQFSLLLQIILVAQTYTLNEMYSFRGVGEIVEPFIYAQGSVRVWVTLLMHPLSSFLLHQKSCVL